MFPNKGKNKNLFKSLLSAHFNLGCGCGNTHPNNLSNVVFDPKPKPKHNPNSIKHPSPSSSSSDGNKTSSTFSPPGHYHRSRSSEPSPARPEGKANGGSSPPAKSAIAVVKDSEDPYEDFRESMMQMIMEKDIFSQEDLHHLLRCFLRLNSPAHRPLILRAFVDVCHSLVSDPDHASVDGHPQSYVSTTTPLNNGV